MHLLRDSLHIPSWIAIGGMTISPMHVMEGFHINFLEIPCGFLYGFPLDPFMEESMDGYMLVHGIQWKDASSVSPNIPKDSSLGFHGIPTNSSIGFDETPQASSMCSHGGNGNRY